MDSSQNSALCHVEIGGLPIQQLCEKTSVTCDMYCMFEYQVKMGASVRSDNLQKLCRKMIVFVVQAPDQMLLKWGGWWDWKSR